MVALIVFALTAMLSGEAAAQPAVSAPVPATGRCLTCHGMTNFVARESASTAVHNFSISPETFARSVHGRLTCEQCHADIDTYPHRSDAARVKVSCAQDCHARDAAGRTYTHRAVAADVDGSAHRARSDGRDGDRPTCLSCHGGGDPHAIAPPKRQSARARMALCAGCHDDGARMARSGIEAGTVAAYKRSFHYKSIVLGGSGQQAAVCDDCHTAHRILPASDPRSSVAPAALPATCGQTGCHLGARRNFAVSGANHLDLRVRREPVLWAEERLFQALTFGTLALLVIGIVLDVQQKFGWIGIVTGGVTRARRVASAAIDAIVVGGRRAGRVARWLLVE